MPLFEGEIAYTSGISEIYPPNIPVAKVVSIHLNDNNPFQHIVVELLGSIEKLDYVLEQLADYTEKQQAIRKKLQQATIYPLVMLVVSLSIVSFLLVYVVPQIVGVFTQQHQALPEITVVVIGLSDFLQAYGLWLLGIIVLLSVWFKWQMRIDSFKLKIDTLILKLPIIGRTIRIVNTARFARTFGILFSAEEYEHT